jgi:hypothetical protein
MAEEGMELEKYKAREGPNRLWKDFLFFLGCL